MAAIHIPFCSTYHTSTSLNSALPSTSKCAALANIPDDAAIFTFALPRNVLKKTRSKVSHVQNMFCEDIQAD